VPPCKVGGSCCLGRRFVQVMGSQKKVAPRGSLLYVLAVGIGQAVLPTHPSRDAFLAIGGSHTLCVNTCLFDAGYKAWCKGSK
jgi:hypothetical protein